MAIEIMQGLFGIKVDAEGFHKGMEEAEQAAKQAVAEISHTFQGLEGVVDTLSSMFGLGVVGVIVGGIAKMVDSAKEWGVQMDEMAGRMGMTTREASTLIGVMERVGISTGTATRSMQILAMEIKQTAEALDPFKTRLGAVLGPMRDMNGQMLSASQVLDLARQKVQSVTTEMEKLQIAQAIYGRQGGGKMLSVLTATNEQFERMKKQVEETGIVMDEEGTKKALAFQDAMAGFNQELRGITIEVGSRLMPALTRVMQGVDTLVIKPTGAIAQAFDNIFFTLMAIGTAAEEAMGRYEKGALKMMLTLEEDQAKEAAAAKATKEHADSIADTARETELAARAQEKLLRITEAAGKLGITTAEDRTAAIKSESEALKVHIALLEKELGDQLLLAEGAGKLTASQVAVKRAEILRDREELARAGLREAQDEYKSDEIRLRTMGALGLENQIALLQRKLNDERIIGEERDKIEADIAEKRRKYAEEAVGIARKLGMISVDQEIEYRKKRAAELIGAGDVLGGAKELEKIRDLVMKQADQVMDFMKKIQIVSLGDEIEFQKRKLAAVKGNAEEEMKILGRIADLDKQLYDQRLGYNLNYTKNVMDSYAKLEAGAKQAGEKQTFEEARREAERRVPDMARMLQDVARGGGTAQAREDATQVAQETMKRFDMMQRTGERVTDEMKMLVDAAKEVLTRAGGGMDIRVPGGPSATVGSLLSSTEGLSTSGLAKGSEIPRLDTSFTDMAVRLRDVLLGQAIPNIQAFSDALAKGIRTMTGSAPTPINAGPGGQTVSTLPGLGTSSGTPAQPGFGEFSFRGKSGFVDQGSTAQQAAFLAYQSAQQQQQDELIRTQLEIQRLASESNKDVAEKLKTATEVLERVKEAFHSSLDALSTGFTVDVKTEPGFIAEVVAKELAPS